MSDPSGTIFDIKRFAVHDGPGIRTTVFFKGCPLRCLWCHNPESMKIGRQVVFFENKCIGCGECYKRCPNGALKATPQGRMYDRDKCTLCGTCVEYCYAEATVMEGKVVSVEEVIEEVKKDMPFYENSNGGVTLSGGEPTMQSEFCLAVLQESKKAGMHTTLDTSGQVKWETFQRILEYVDLVLYDMKHMDPLKHKEYTGLSNENILSNLKKLDALFLEYFFFFICTDAPYVSWFGNTIMYFQGFLGKSRANVIEIFLHKVDYLFADICQFGRSS